MTALGNDPVLLTLLALLIACIGYAAGRLHQWYRTGQDRDEAYRDGYDAATRSTLSLAARMVVPRRDEPRAGASAAGHPSRAAGTGPGGAPPSVVPSVRSSGPHHPSVLSLRSSAPPAPFFAPSVSRRNRSTTFSPPVAARPVAGSSASPSATPAAAETVSPSPAAGGPPASAAGTSAVPSPGASTAAGPGAGPGRSGRHLVPDELVRAATYRLTPDRVARAKVRGADGSGDSPEEPPPGPSVPKPRSS